MDTIYRIASNVARVVSHRGFAASVLAVGSAGVVALASVAAEAVAGAPADKVVLSMQNDSYVVRADAFSLSPSVPTGFDVTVKADGADTMLRVSTGTVESALETIGVSVSADDVLSVPLDETLTPGMEITVQRVTYRDVTETETIPFETKTKKDTALEKGTTKVATKGQNGERTITYRERLVDGEVVESNRLSAKVTKQPVNEVKVVGTKSASTTTKQAAKKAVSGNGSYTDDDVYALAVAIYREAGSDYLSDEHRAMVGCVVMNRVKSREFPNTIRGVLTQPGQYAGLWTNGIYFPSGTNTSSNAVRRAYRIAREVLNGQWECPSNVVFQAGFQQGSGVYRAIAGGGTVTYFCYR